jgi:hypothetical protein
MSERDSTGVSRNGSLGARARFGWMTRADLSSSGSGWEKERECIVGEPGRVP